MNSWNITRERNILIKYLPSGRDCLILSRTNHSLKLRKSTIVYAGWNLSAENKWITSRLLLKAFSSSKSFLSFSSSFLKTNKVLITVKFLNQIIYLNNVNKILVAQFLRTWGKYFFPSVLFSNVWCNSMNSVISLKYSQNPTSQVISPILLQ